MKKILTVFLTMILTFTLTACRTKNNETENPGGNENNNVENNIDYKTWGATDRVTASNENGTESFYINVPTHYGTYQGTGIIGKQSDGSMVILDGQNKLSSPNVDKLQNTFPTYFDQVKTILKDYYRMRGDDFAFVIEKTEKTSINGYDMVKFTGTHSYTYEREPVNCNWVAYATQLKSNGAYAYWMVLDAAENKTSNSDIAEIAYNMAQTFREEV